ncbi:unnamed protein product [Ectocarpus sp. 8 AP-2014]
MSSFYIPTQAHSMKHSRRRCDGILANLRVVPHGQEQCVRSLSIPCLHVFH